MSLVYYSIEGCPFFNQVNVILICQFCRNYIIQCDSHMPVLQESHYSM